MSREDTHFLSKNEFDQKGSIDFYLKGNIGEEFEDLFHVTQLHIKTKEEDESFHGEI